MVEQEGTKYCNKCGQTKHLSKFYRASRSSDGYRSDCKACNNKRRHPKAKKRHLIPWKKIAKALEGIIIGNPGGTRIEWLAEAKAVGLVAKDVTLGAFTGGLWRSSGLDVNKIIAEQSGIKNGAHLYKVVAAENKRLRRRLDRQTDTEETIIEAVKALGVETLLQVPQIVSAPVPQEGHAPEEMVVCLSDVHWGKECDKDDLMGLGPYNQEVARERLEAYFEAIERLYNNHSTYLEIPRLNIFALGDLVEGDAIFRGQRFYVFESIVEQCFSLANILAPKLVYLSQFIPEIWMYCVIGNHGRPQREKGESHWKSNFDYVLYKVLSLMLQNNPRIHIITSESRLMGLERKGQLFLLNHGDDIQSYYRTPFYGMSDAANRWTTMFRKFWDYIMLSHFHQTASFDVSFGEVLVNGSFVGPDEFAIKKMKKASAPKQICFGVHARRGVTWRYSIRLSDEKGMSGTAPDELGILTPHDSGEVRDQEEA